MVTTKGDIMLTTSVIEGTNVVSVTLGGSVSVDEDAAARRVFEELAARHGDARMLLDYEGVDLSRVEPAAVWENLKGTHLLEVVDRIGIVAHTCTMSTFVKALGALSKIDVRCFIPDQRLAALAWLAS